MTALREDTGYGTAGAALCTFGRLRSAPESRRVEVLPNGDVRAERLMGSVQVWHPTTTPLRDDTQLRLVSEVVAAAPTLPASVAPAGGGVALATSAASTAGQPAASSGPSTAAMPSTGPTLPTATGASAPARTGSHRSNGGDGESVGALRSAVQGGAR